LGCWLAWSLSPESGTGRVPRKQEPGGRCVEQGNAIATWRGGRGDEGTVQPHGARRRLVGA
jgi:hypothetical protein